MGKKKLLIVEDDPQDLEILSERLDALGYEIVTATRLSEAKKLLVKNPDTSVVISDVRLPDGEGIELIALAAQPVLLMTAFAEVQNAVEAMQKGAFHYLTKPIRPEELEVLLERAVQYAETASELKRLREIHRDSAAQTNMVVRSDKMRDVMDMVQVAAESESTILVFGESGTGKELVAKSVHRMSPRSGGPFVAVNCGSVPATLLEAELFGHEKGAFTGAIQRRIGKFERAQRGTLFLDEIGTLPMELQTRLLRAIQEHEIERVGGTSPIKVDFRLIAATNIDLSLAVERKEFRDDLYYRLNVIPIELPPLRERREEIPALVAHFMAQRDAPDVSIDPTAMECLMAYGWPGNIRELENAVERALVLSRKTRILPRFLPPEIRRVGSEILGIEGDSSGAADGFPQLEEIKCRHVERALRMTKGRKEEAAELLGIHRNTLRNILARKDESVRS